MHLTIDLHRARVAATRLALLVGALLYLGSAALADGHTKCTLDAQGQSLRDVVTALAKQAGVMARFQPGVGGVVSARVNGTPFEDALTSVAAAAGYGWRLENGVYVIGRFGHSAADATPTSATLPLKHLEARALAQSFGYLDLGVVADGRSAADLRWLLPEGLSGPPRPSADGKALEVSGTASAVADVRQLLVDLDHAPTGLTFRYVVARAQPTFLDTLKVAWAQGVMNAGRTGEGRDALYTSGDFEAMLQRCEAGADGLTVLAKGRLSGADLAVMSAPADASVKLSVAARVEPALALRLWLKAAITVDGATVDVAADGGLLPPDEGCLIISRAKAGVAGPEALLVLVMPTVAPPE
jgi:hypothetical protein